MTLHLIHIPLDMCRFNRWAGERGLIRRRTFDAGYAFHILLSSMFGKAVLQPFRLFASERRPKAALYGYSGVDQTELRKLAAAVAPPDCEAVVDPRRLRSKPMPEHFEQGERLGFDLRLRPVRRVRSGVHDPQLGSSLKRGSEVDAYRLELIRRFPAESGTPPSTSAAANAGITRQSVYTEWLSERLGSAASIEHCELAGLQRTRAIRGDSGGPEGPDAVLHGTMTVASEHEFIRLLRKGVGRHRAYGYGMLLLRPPGPHAPNR